MKLNKHGWGIVSFLVFIAIFIICLLISAWGFRKLGLLDEEYHFVEFSQIKENRENMKKEEESKQKAKEEKETNSYSALEEKMVEAAKKYVKDFYDNTLGEATLNIKVSVMQDKKYLDTLKDSNNKKCSGYVSVSKENDSSLTYIPYLKCKKYTSKGYEERKDD